MTAVGIDLGTGTSAIAVFKNGKAEVIPNQEGEYTTPSFVAWSANKEWLVGTPAQRQAITNPQDTVYVAKRFIGMKYADVGDAKNKVSYKVKENAAKDVAFEIGGKELTPEEVGAKIIAKLKHAAENYLGEAADQVVCSVPAYFNQQQRSATADACRIAGFKEVLRIVNEPTASALAFGLDKKKAGKVLVFDTGSGTHDVSILDISDGVIEVLSTSGRHFLGGEDFDNALVDHFAELFKKDSGIDIRKDRMALQRLKTEAEKAKRELSQKAEAEINIPFITADASGPKHLLCKISRSKFEALIEKFVDEAFVCVEQALKDAKLTADQIEDIVFVGGSTRIPILAERVKKMFGKEPNRSINPDLGVAIGAAIQAAALTNQGVSDLLLLDVCSLSLSLETLGGVATVLIPRNTTIPTKRSQVFSTAIDNQSAVDIKVAQGERPMFADNQLLDTFKLDGIPPSRRGTPQIEVSFDIDANGILHVVAKDQATGKSKDITIKSGLSNVEIERMIKDAEANEAADKHKAELAQKFNQLDGLILSLRKTLEDNADKLSGMKEPINEALTRAQETFDKRDEVKLDSELKALETVAHKAAEELYKQAPQTGPVEATVVEEVKEAV